MKILLLTVSILLAGFTGMAQHNHFVYVQSDNKQPFYIKLNDKVYSSSSSGYAIISKLQKGEYTLLVGFPKNEFPQQSIPVIVNADGGYILKNFGEKGWGLYNIQTSSISMAGTGNTNIAANAPAPVKKDDFSGTLANVVNTPSVQQVIADTVAKAPVKEVTLITEPVHAVAEKNISVLSSVKDNSGRAVVYVDKTSGSNDTIRVFIPYEAAVATKVVPAVQKEDVKTNAVPATDDKKFLDIELTNPNQKQDSVQVPVKEAKVETTTTAATQPVSAPEVKLITPAEAKLTPATEVKTTTPAVTSTPSAPLTINSDCKSLATDDDFLKIRKKMAAEDNDEDMIAAAKKMFKSKCYSTEQVKNLSVLFLKDKGRYGFFDAAYPFIHDTQNFGRLESQLSDPYYVTRFKAMIRN